MIGLSGLSGLGCATRDGKRIYARVLRRDETGLDCSTFSPGGSVTRILSVVVLLALASLSAVYAQRPAFEPITDKTLLNPAPEDWLMYSRTYDAQRFSPLRQITRENVGGLKEAFKLEFPAGQQESI